MNNTSLIFKDSLTVSPPSQNLWLSAGETYSGSIIVSNPANSENAIEFFATVVPYGIKADDYSADFSSSSIYNNIVDWVTLETDHGVIAPNEFTTINYTVSVPADAPAGGQYCAISIRNTNDDSSTLINEVIGIASILYGRVDGEIVEIGEVTSATIPSIVFTPPINSTVVFTNSGNVHLNSTIKTTITNFFTGEVIYNSDSLQENRAETVMPGTTRLATFSFDQVPELGVVNVSQDIYYNSKLTSVNQTVFICPIWFLILTLITLIAIISIISLRIRHHLQKSKAKKSKTPNPTSPSTSTPTK